MPVSVDRCPHCARPSLFPNVTRAAEPAEVAALDTRYGAALATANTNGTEAIVSDLERETATRSRVVISRDSSEVYRLACGDNQLYATFYNLVEAGFRLPTDSKWDLLRLIGDAVMFPYYQQHVRFGALTLDQAGPLNYGDCHMILKTDMVDFRTSAFTENTSKFASNNNWVIPPGHRSTWATRGRLAVAKLSSAVTASTSAADLPAILKRDGPTSDDDSFVEAQVYGSISMLTVEQVSLTRRSRPAVRLNALKEKLKQFNVKFVVT